jgi:Fe-S-cluster containining protein
MASSIDLALCQTCGACCAYSREWPRFTTEDDAVLELIPREFIDHSRGRMRCSGDRCAALVGEVGVATSCAVYDVRPDVCRACEPADEACQLARQRFGLVAAKPPANDAAASHLQVSR